MLSRQRVPNLGNLISRPPNFDHIPLHLHVHGGGHERGILLAFALLASRAPRQVGLVLAALGVRQVGAVVLVHRQT